MRTDFRQRLDKSLGKSMLAALDEVKLEIGKITFTHQQMIDLLGCGNFGAAARLTKVLKKLDVTTVAQLFKLDPGSLARQRSVGMTTLYVAMCLLDYNDFNVEKWWGWHQEDNVVKFSTYKAKLLKRAKKRAA